MPSRMSAHFKMRVDKAIREIHACKLAPGFDRTYAPGEKELLTPRRIERDGIPLNHVTLADLRRTAEARGISTVGIPWLADVRI